MTGTALFGILALALMLTLWDRHVQKHRCSYWGMLRGHTDHCPWQGKD